MILPQHINEVKCGIFVVVRCFSINSDVLPSSVVKCDDEERVAKHMSEMIQFLIVAHVF